MKKFHFGSVIFIVCMLFLGKIVLSGFYLKTATFKISQANVALASEKKPLEPTMAGLSEGLRKKEQELKAKEEMLKKKEAELMPLEKKIETKMAELNELQGKLTSFAKALAEREKALNDSKMGHLVALYSSMEPARAAAIMDKLQMKTVVLILRHMKGKSAGQILGVMNPEKGALISEELSRMD